MAKHLITCEECGASKYTDRPDQVYCSRECVSAAIRNARQDNDYRKWKRAVIDREDGTCQMCGCDDTEAKIIAHHIVPLSECKEARTIPSNGMALCTTCHDVIHDQVGNTSFRTVFGRYNRRGMST